MTQAVLKTLDGESWRKAILMARTEPNLVIDAIKRAAKLKGCKKIKPPA